MPRQEIIERIVELAAHIEGVDRDVLRQCLEFSHVHRQIERLFEKDWAQRDLTPMQVRILLMLYHHEEGIATPAMLAEHVLLTRSAMTSALDSLERLGYTMREPHPSDRRMVAVRLTPAGRAFIGEWLPILYRKLGLVMGRLTQEERAQLLKLYQKILDALHHEEEKGGQ